MTASALWLAAFACGVCSLLLTRDAGARGASGVEFDKPVARALVAGLASAALLIAAIFAVTLDGVVAPALVGAALAGCGALARRRLNLSGLHGLAGPLAAAAFFCAIGLFQSVFGDADFGLANIFGDR